MNKQQLIQPLLKKISKFLITAAIVSVAQTSHASDDKNNKKYNYLYDAFLTSLKNHNGKLDIKQKQAVTLLTGTLKNQKLTLACQLCTPAMLQDKAFRLGADLGNMVLKQRPAAIDASLLEQSDILNIDNISIHNKKQPLHIQKGSHLISVSRNGITGQQKIIVNENQTFKIKQEQLTLLHPHPRLLPASVAISGLSLAAIAGGAIFIALDGKCASRQTNADGSCVSSHDTKALGITMTTLGIAGVTAGIFLLARYLKYNKTARMTFGQNR
jgi:hypothetical protein